MTIEDQYLTVAEVASRLSIHPSTVRRRVKGGKLEAMRVGRAMRISTEALAAYELAHARERIKLPYRWPPTRQETERRRRTFREMIAARDAMPPLGISTTELVRQARRELEERAERWSRRPL